MDRRQKHVFLRSEGDAWFVRNSVRYDPANDPVLIAIDALQVRPKTILEIGCGGGGRLEALRVRFGARCCGLDPSNEAIDHIRRQYPELEVKQGTADALPYDSGSIDLLVFGFCLYLCDPQDHFVIVAEAHRVLAETGFLAIFDFCVKNPYANEYKHSPGLRSYKMQWSNMFCSHPSYRLLSRRYHEHENTFGFEVDEAVTIDILRKDVTAAFPLRR